MAEIPNALVKDLLSTGYFFEELKKYTGSKEIDLPSLSRNFAVPYLSKKSESYQRLGQPSRATILDLAVKFLYDADDTEMAETILGLKKVAESEVDTNEKSLRQDNRLEKSERLSCRQKTESAQSLCKLLVSIIRVFNLAQVITKRDKSEGTCSSVEDAIKDYWELSLSQAM